MPIYEPGQATPFDPATLVRECVESGASAMLLDKGRAPAAFFDLSTGLAGDLVHRVTLYRIPLAIVAPDVEAHSPHFRDFAREANRGKAFRSFPTRAEATAWLEEREREDQAS